MIRKGSDLSEIYLQNQPTPNLYLSGSDYQN